MSNPPWQLEVSCARLAIAGVRATVNLSTPAAGVEISEIAGEAVERARLFQLAWCADGSNENGDPLPAAQEDTLADAYVRGNDLVATYSETPERPFSSQVYWRLVPTDDDPAHFCLELVAAVQTSQLDTEPRLTSESVFSAHESFRLVNNDSASFEPLDFSHSQTPALEPDKGVACILFRLPGDALSYAEMVHPDDFRQSEATTLSASDGTLSIRHRLIARWMEKGVIVKSRIRGAFVAREGDLETAAACYGKFAAEELPLTV